MAGFKSKFKPKNPEKYVNKKNLNNIVCRSSWERFVCRWCDKNPEVDKWGLEEVVIPYISKADGRKHRYFMDFNILFKNGTKLLVEVKPKQQTQEPQKTGKKTQKRFLNEVRTYSVNISKWEQAIKFAKARDCKFVIWTEDELQRLGMKMNVSKKWRYVTYANKKKKLNGRNGKKTGS